MEMSYFNVYFVNASSCFSYMLNVFVCCLIFVLTVNIIFPMGMLHAVCYCSGNK